jgi:hypothetical protein
MPLNRRKSRRSGYVATQMYLRSVVVHEIEYKLFIRRFPDGKPAPKSVTIVSCDNRFVGVSFFSDEQAESAINHWEIN